jgi:hemolysin activation/secretion protein
LHLQISKVDTLVKPQSKTLSGILNLQVYAGGYEKFRIEQQADGTYTIESVAFPGRYLHISKDKVLVSGQVGEKERFHLLRKGGA